MFTALTVCGVMTHAARSSGSCRAAMACAYWKLLARGAPYGPALHADPALATLCGDPRFRELMRPKG